jgi:hypothetical protein
VWHKTIHFSHSILALTLVTSQSTFAQ